MLPHSVSEADFFGEILCHIQGEVVLAMCHQRVRAIVKVDCQTNVTPWTGVLYHVAADIMKMTCVLKKSRRRVDFIPSHLEKTKHEIS